MDIFFWPYAVSKTFLIFFLFKIWRSLEKSKSLGAVELARAVDFRIIKMNSNNTSYRRVESKSTPLTH